MDYTTFLSTLDFSAIGFVGLATFGSVAAVSMVYKKRTGLDIASDTKLFLSIFFAVLFGFVPADFGIVVLNKFRDGLSAALLVNGLYQGLGKIGEAFAGTKKMSS